MRASLISTIVPEREETWRGQTFLTADLDWVEDEILERTVQYLTERSVRCTFFATHTSELVTRLCADHTFEIGIHPNYNPLIAGEPNALDHPSGFDRLRAVFPDATAVRSHSLLHSSQLQNHFARCGFTHESNTYIPASAGHTVRPWRLWNGLIEVPVAWMDDIHLYDGGGAPNVRALSALDLKVIAFHPIHLYLNSDSVDRYHRYKAGKQTGVSAETFVNHDKLGVRNALDEMLEKLA
jgi:hypothetical protein